MSGEAVSCAAPKTFLSGRPEPEGGRVWLTSSPHSLGKHLEATVAGLDNAPPPQGKAPSP